MTKYKFYSGFAVISAVLILSFNNCSNVEFEDAMANSEVGDLGEEAFVDLPPDGLHIEDEPEITESSVSFEEEQAVLDRLTMEEVEVPIAVTELEDNPELIEKYRCSNGKNVMICHIANDLNAKTQCVGEPSVSNHYTHIRSYYEGDAEHSIIDYFGPCRHL